MKYMGSKSRISKEIIPIIQKYIDDGGYDVYLEPFVGGANVIDKIKCNKRIGCDKHEYLIDFLKSIQNNWLPPTHISVEHYMEVKESYKKQDRRYENYYYGAIGFLGAFRGLFFDSQGCKDYISQGRTRNNYVESRNNILKQKKNLANIEFYHKDYRDITPSNAVIYCDPPYMNTSQKGYADANNFNSSEFWETMRLWSKNNIVLISEYNAPSDFKCIWQKEVSTCLSVSSRKKDIEKLFRIR